MINFKWIDTGTVTGTTTFDSGSSLREVDCFDYLSFSFSYSNGVGNTTVSILWFDQYNNWLYTDVIVDSLASDSQYILYTVKGSYAEVQLTSPSSSAGSFNFQLWGNLIRQ